ncbi:hypothetical protein NMD04_03460 [Citrobacter meridianamericanus]
MHEDNPTMSVGDALQIFFSQTAHSHHRVAVDAVLQHCAGNFQSRFALTFPDASLFAPLFTTLDTFLAPSSRIFCSSRCANLFMLW